jgi:hypothetical protein
MKKIFPLLIALAPAYLSFAQNPQPDYKIALKIYNLASLEEYTNVTASENDSSTQYTFNTRKLDIFHPTFAYQWSNKKEDFHEIELTRFSLSNTVFGAQSQMGNSNSTMLSGSERMRTIDISVRYEYIRNFRKGLDKKMLPSLGFAINPYCNHIVTQPIVSTSFPTSSWHLGARMFVVPRLNFTLSKRIFLDINIPICIVDNYQLRNKYANPAIPLDNRITYSNLFELLPRVYSIRFGVGFKL